MTVLVTLILTILTFAFITYPLLKRKSRSVNSVEDERSQELYSKRDTTYSMLKELEFDFQTGILTEDDYQDLETRYRRKAISILREINDLGKDTEVEEEIERQILELRQDKSQFCSQCGVRYQDDDRVCSRCGANLSQGEGID